MSEPNKKEPVNKPIGNTDPKHSNSVDKESARITTDPKKK